MKKQELDRWKRYFDHRNNGLSIEQAADKARGISRATAYRFERGDQSSSGLEAAELLGVTRVGGATVDKPLSPEARKALGDFEYFRKRYFGRKSTPWQIKAANAVVESLEDPAKNYIVMNEPPGSGKSTLFTCDIPCWLIVRDRTIRIQISSRTQTQAEGYVRRIKLALEREAPLIASIDDFERGFALNAEASLLGDFGAFKPEGRSDKWSGSQLVVRQLDGVSTDDKEATVMAFGQDSGFLGNRFDFVVWDDLVDSSNMKTQNSRESTQEWWDGIAESRLEPGGTMLLQGQRISGNDLYRYCLNKRTLDDKPRYQHIIFKAHYDELCTGNHEGLEAWPKSCLLDPHRLPMVELEGIKHNNPRAYEVLYQQGDGHGITSLLDEHWITGGVDAYGYDSPGSLDHERVLLDPPVNLKNGNCWSFVTVDPSPTEFWGIIWWAYDPETNRRYVIDLHRKRLNPEQFLSLDLNTFEWSGLMHEMFFQSNDIGIPITNIIFEANAAQRWWLSSPHVQKWEQVTGVRAIPHQTNRNKQDPEYGLESIGDLFRQGYIRIPWGDFRTRTVMQDLVTEGTRYPDYDTDDLVLSTWFHKLAVENHYTPHTKAMYRLNRPAWLQSARRGMYAR